MFSFCDVIATFRDIHIQRILKDHAWIDKHFLLLESCDSLLLNRLVKAVKKTCHMNKFLT